MISIKDLKDDLNDFSSEGIILTLIESGEKVLGRIINISDSSILIEKINGNRSRVSIKAIQRYELVSKYSMISDGFQVEGTDSKQPDSKQPNFEQLDSKQPDLEQSDSKQPDLDSNENEVKHIDKARDSESLNDNTKNASLLNRQKITKKDTGDYSSEIHEVESGNPDDEKLEYIKQDISYQSAIQGIESILRKFDLQDFQNNVGLDLQFVGLKINRFDSNQIDIELSKEIEKLLNSYNYAKKVKEVHRLSDILPKLRNLKIDFAESEYIGLVDSNYLFLLLELKKFEEAYTFIRKNKSSFDEVRYWYLCFYSSLQGYFLEDSLFCLQKYLTLHQWENGEDFINCFLSLCNRTFKFENLFALLKHNLKLNEGGNKGKLSFLLYSIAYFLNQRHKEKEAYFAFKLIDCSVEEIELKTARLFMQLTNQFDVKDSLHFQIDKIENDYTIATQRIIDEEEKARELEENKRNPKIPENGWICKYSIEQQGGVIATRDGRDIYFSVNQIIDEVLRKKIKTQKIEQDIPIFFIPMRNPAGRLTAIRIQSPPRLDTLFHQVESLIKTKQYIRTLQLLELILEAFPDNENALILKNEVVISRESDIYNNKRRSRKGREEFYYKRAKESHQKKNFKAAIRFFKLAIDNEERLETVVLDLASVYIEQNKDYDQAIAVIENNLYRLNNRNSAYNQLVHYYSAKQEFRTAISYLKKSETISPKEKIPFIFHYYAICYFQLGDYDRAEGYVHDLLELKPGNSAAIKQLKALKEAKSSGDYAAINDLFKIGQFVELARTTNLSVILQKALDKNDYEGVVTSVRAKGESEFSDKTLKSVQELITDSGRGRQDERASWLLTETKLIKLLEKGNDPEKIDSSLAKYCHAMAQIKANHRYPLEVVQFYLREAFKLHKRWGGQENRVYMYILSFKYDDPEQYLENLKNSKWKDALINILEEVRPLTSFWNGLLDIFVVSRPISAKVLGNIYENVRFRELSVDFLNSKGQTLSTNCSADEFDEAWNEARKQRQLDFENLKIQFDTLRNEEDIENISFRIKNSIQQVLDREQFHLSSQLEKFYCARISEISEKIVQYLQTNNFDNKENLFQILKQFIQKLLEEIEDQPTLLSSEAFIPLLEYLLKLIRENFENFEKSSTPRLSVNVISAAKIAQNKEIELQLEIENHEESSPINDLTIKVQPSDHCTPLHEEKGIISSELLRGDQKRIIALPIMLANSAIGAKTIIVTISYAYNYNKGKDHYEEDKILNLPLYSENEFQEVHNPYASVADGGPVIDEEMFYGRDELVTRIVESVSSPGTKHIALYGQKRSGKSSVLYHIEKELKRGGKSIPVQFSFGEIIENVNMVYYMILSGIKDYLEEMAVRGELDLPRLPSFTIRDFNEEPSIIFNQKIKEFKFNCQSLKNWKERKLIILIDEFTYLYTAILRENVKPSFMKTWKAIVDKGMFSAILVGQDVMPKFKRDFPNEFGVTEDIRLTYLDKNSAQRLIEEPIWDKARNASRYYGEATDKIIDWTAANPYYIQMFCSRLVDNLNDRKELDITVVNVEDIAIRMVKGAESLELDKFDNLLTAGDADLEEIPLEYTRKILTQIAIQTKEVGYCTREQISLKSPEEDNKVLEDLKTREVIEITQGGYYKIRVRLFQEYLYVNYKYVYV